MPWRTVLRFDIEISSVKSAISMQQCLSIFDGMWPFFDGMRPVVDGTYFGKWSVSLRCDTLSIFDFSAIESDASGAGAAFITNKSDDSGTGAKFSTLLEIRQVLLCTGISRGGVVRRWCFGGKLRRCACVACRRCVGLKLLRCAGVALLLNGIELELRCGVGVALPERR